MSADVVGGAEGLVHRSRAGRAAAAGGSDVGRWAGRCSGGSKEGQLHDRLLSKELPSLISWASLWLTHFPAATTTSARKTRGPPTGMLCWQPLDASFPKGAPLSKGTTPTSSHEIPVRCRENDGACVGPVAYDLREVCTMSPSVLRWRCGQPRRRCVRGAGGGRLVMGGGTPRVLVFFRCLVGAVAGSCNRPRRGVGRGGGQWAAATTAATGMVVADVVSVATLARWPRPWGRRQG